MQQCRGSLKIACNLVDCAGAPIARRLANLLNLNGTYHMSSPALLSPSHHFGAIFVMVQEVYNTEAFYYGSGRTLQDKLQTSWDHSACLPQIHGFCCFANETPTRLLTWACLGLNGFRLAFPHGAWRCSHGLVRGTRGRPDSSSSFINQSPWHNNQSTTSD